MVLIEVKDISKLLKNAYYIGKGTTAKCYCSNKSEVIKLYLNNQPARNLLNNGDMLARLKFIGEIQNDSYIGPKKILVKDGKVIGYIYPYVQASTLRRISSFTRLFDLYQYYHLLLEDTHEISDKKFRLFDVHSKNILYDGRFYIIDLDKGNEVDYDPYFYNASTIKDTIMKHIYRAEPWEIIQFVDEELQHAYLKNTWETEEQVYDFFKLLAEKSKSDNPTIHQLRRVKRMVYENSYYKG